MSGNKRICMVALSTIALFGLALAAISVVISENWNGWLFAATALLVGGSWWLTNNPPKMTVVLAVLAVWLVGDILRKRIHYA